MYILQYPELMIRRCFSRWNQLDVAIVLLSVIGIALEEIKTGFIPINPTIIRVMRVMRIARGYLSRNYLMFSLLDIRPPCGQLIGRTVPLLRVMRIMRIARGYLTQHII